MSMEPLSLIVGVTGHRDLVEDEVFPLRKRVKGFLHDLVEQYPALEVQVLCGLAEGADQLVAEEALSLGLTVIAVLPFEQEEFENDFPDPDALDKFRQLAKQCQLIQLPRLQADEALDLSTDIECRSRHYAQLGIFLSNHCQILMALWDSRRNTSLGGTGSVVTYHLTGVMPGYDLGEASPNLLADNENDLTYHIVCSRNREGGEPSENLSPLECYWVTGHFGRQSGQHIPHEYAQMLDRLAEFATDLNREQEDIAAQANGLMSAAIDAPRPPGLDFVDDLYTRADWMAVFYQKKFAFGLMLSHLLAVLMGLVFIVYSEFIEQSLLAISFMALFAIGVLFHLLGEKKEWHRKYLDYRALAEGLRVQVYWNLAGVINHRSATFAYDNFLQKQDVDLAWIRHVMRLASLRRSRHHIPDERWVPWVIDQWVGEPGGREGQLGYYQYKARTRAKVYRRTVLYGNLALWGGVAMAGFLGVFARVLSDQQAVILLILMGVLPLIAGVRDAYSHKKADKELIKQYQFMAHVFANARRLIDGSDDVQFQRQVLKAVGNAALEEHAEWLLMHRERPLEHGGI